MSTARPKCLLFDLDGTLQDTYAIHYQAFQATFNHYGRALSETEYQAAYSPNWLLTYQMLGLPPELWDEADAIWLEEAGKRSPQPFPGVLATLGILHTQMPLGIVTSGQNDRVRKEISHNGLQEFFQVVVTGSDVTHPKPAPDGIHTALAKLGIAPENCIYVGDTGLDYQTALAAGAGFIGIHSQFNSLPHDTPCLILEDFSHLLDLFEQPKGGLTQSR